MNARFTTWLSDEERGALEARARSERTSKNYLVRSAIRQFLGLDPPSQMLHVTTDTSTNERAHA